MTTLEKAKFPFFTFAYLRYHTDCQFVEFKSISNWLASGKIWWYEIHIIIKNQITKESHNILVLWLVNFYLICSIKLIQTFLPLECFCRAVIGLQYYIHEFIDIPIWMYSRAHFLCSLQRILQVSIVPVLSGQHFPVAHEEFMPSFCRFSVYWFVVSLYQ